NNDALQVLVESGKLSEESLGTMLLRKTDWHDSAGIKWLLEQGVDPNRRTRWGKTALHNAVLRDNALEIIEALLDHGADPTLIEGGAPIDAKDGRGRTALALAVRACVDSYWTYRRTPEAVRALLEAGASVSGVAVPSGYAEVDELLRIHQNS